MGSYDEIYSVFHQPSGIFFLLGRVTELIFGSPVRESDDEVSIVFFRF